MQTMGACMRLASTDPRDAFILCPSRPAVVSMIRLIPSAHDPCTSHCEEDSVRAIRAFDNTILHWVSLGRGQGVYELRAGDEVVGTLRRVKLPGSLCVLDTADGTWTCKRSSRLAAAVTVRVAGEETNYAVFTHHWPTTGLALLFPWLFTPLVPRAFHGGFLVPFLGILFLPFTTLMYVLAWQPAVGLTGWGWFWVIIGFLLDLGSYSGSAFGNRSRVPGMSRTPAY